jgi:hypothetical protein
MRPMPVMHRIALACALTALSSLSACTAVTVGAAEGAAQQTPALTPIARAPANVDPCRPRTPADPHVVVEPVRTGTGSCLPLADVAVYRCDPAFDPVAVLRGGSDRPRRFIGGGFAVTLDPIPGQLRALGVTSFGRLSDDPTQPRTLVVDAAGTPQRWLELPKTLPSPPSAAMIGDSILDGARDAVVAGLPGWNVTIDAVIGRSSGGGVAAAQSAAAASPDVVVVELGVNDHDAASFASNAATILQAVQGARLVVWVTAHGPDPVTDEVDRAIVDAMAAIPNGAIADWDAHVPLDQLSSDGVHLADASGAAFADFLDPILERWREAVVGRGADRCGAVVLAA